MEIPEALRQALEKQLGNIENENLTADLMRGAEVISLRYRTQSGSGAPLLTLDSEALAYAASRMPATYGAAYSALSHTMELIEDLPESMLDAGAGTGAAAWAADSLLNLKEIICLEREDAMRRIGEGMMQYGSQSLKDAAWIKHDLNTDRIDKRADLVIASYILNEMTEQQRIKVIEKLWYIANKLLVLIEPGTPAGFANLLAARRMLIASGAYTAAPCVNSGECQLPKDNWCAFSCRIPRSSLHRRLKKGDAPYEDEKFIYMAFARKKSKSAVMRVLRHPDIKSGYVTLEICEEGGIRRIKATKKDGALYKLARKAKSGDSL